MSECKLNFSRAATEISASVGKGGEYTSDYSNADYKTVILLRHSLHIVNYVQLITYMQLSTETKCGNQPLPHNDEANPIKRKYNHSLMQLRGSE